MSTNPERDAFDAGARAMREACAKLIQAWWGAAPAGHRHPGHPHQLELQIRSVKPERLDGRP